jgi:serine/threonine protein kinase
MDARRPDDTRTEDGFAAAWSSDGVTRSLAPTASGIPADLPFLFSGGQLFGPYRIVRPIGKGGMGQVYEAEEIDSGRRVAIKILSRGIGDEEERERFLQEGRLAASLSHPNTVCVFGTTEVQGFPVIAMELAPSGTLKDLVVEGSPMPPAPAVDAVLQVVAGLEAAAAIGILHRDIKPSNCFVAADGRVLVGDFGLSIATLARGAAESGGTILGTPGFASPEQLRGDGLDIRSDIYAVGATLYYLLGGKAPFDDPDLKTMMTRVATEPPPALALVRPDLPSRLTAVVTKCLAKKPADRYATYAALRSALEPFRSASLTPAPLARRLLAGAIDNYLASLPVLPINMYFGARILDASDGRMLALSLVPALIATIVYYVVLEGRFGCGAGKALFNLRVVDAAETTPGARRAFLRVLVFVMPAEIVRIVMTYFLAPLARTGQADTTTQSLVAVVAVGASVLMFAVQFSTARRRNGWAGLHDLASGTHVVVRPRAMEVRRADTRATRAAGVAFDGDRVGPYLVPRGSFAQAHARRAPLVVEGFDDRLRRYIWVELLPEGTPPVSAWRRDLGRPGRMRWLSGRRHGGDCWDAYEAVEGAPLARLIATPQPWSRVRHWVCDLAHELAQASKDGSTPVLAVDRIWIGVDDRARLLEFAPPGAEPLPANREPRTDLRPSSSDSRTAQRFLYDVAIGALSGKDPGTLDREPPGLPLPLAARAWLLSLGGGPDAPAVLDGASDLLRTPALFPRGRRAAAIAMSAFIPVVMPIAVVAALRIQQQSQTKNPGAFAYNACVTQLAAYEKKGDARLTAAERKKRELVEVYIAEHLRDEADEAAAVARSFPIVTRARGSDSLAQQAIARHPVRTPAQIKEADAAVADVLSANARGLERLRSWVTVWGLVVYITIWSFVVVACIGLVGALVTGSGFALRAAGAAIVNGRGEPASRLRALWRAIVTWSPAAVGLALLQIGPKVQDMTVAVAAAQTLPLLLLAAGAAMAIRNPPRGWQDRLAGTWIVPR